MSIVSSYNFPIEAAAPPSMPTPRELAAVIVRQRRTALGTATLVALAMWATGMWTPTYVAQMKLLVLRQRVDPVVSTEAVSPAIWGGDQVSEDDLNSEVELLKSTDLLRRVVVDTGLAFRASGAQRPSDRAIDTAVESLTKHLQVEAVRKTNMIAVQYESRDPQMASRVLNSLSQAYTDKHLEVHRPAGEFKFFDQQVVQYRENFTRLREKILHLNQLNGAVSPQMERDQALQRVSDFDASAQQARQALQEGTLRLQTLRAQLNSLQPQITGSVRTSNNEILLGQLKQKLSTLELQHTEMAARFAPAYRPLQDLEQQIAALKQSIAVEASNPLHEETKTANPVYEWAQGEVARVQAEDSTMAVRAVAAANIAAQYRAKAQDLNQQSMAQEDLVREEKAQEENYLLYLHKREEARNSDELDRRGIINIAMAQHPVTPTLPRRPMQYAALMTMLMCATLSMSAAFVKDWMAPSFRTPDEIVRYLDIPVLAALPKA